VGSRLPAVLQELPLRAAGFFEGVGQHGQQMEGPDGKR
jgi:hypothetical protein